MNAPLPIRHSTGDRDAQHKRGTPIGHWFVLLALFALGTALLLYPGVQQYKGVAVFSTSEPFQLRFILDSLPSRSRCEQRLADLQAKLQASCSDCKPLRALCSEASIDSDLDTLSESPLKVPSARFQGGIVLYEPPAIGTSSSESQQRAALQACRASELVAAGDPKASAAFACFNPGSRRPLEGFESPYNPGGLKTSYLLMRLLGALLVLGPLLIVAGGMDHGQRSLQLNPKAQRTRRLPVWWEKAVMLAADAGSLLTAQAAVVWAAQGALPSLTGADKPGPLLIHLSLSAMLLLWLLVIQEHYKRRKALSDQIRDLVVALLACSLGSLAAAGALPGQPGNPAALVAPWVLALPTLLIGRKIAIELMLKQGIWLVPAVIIGGGKNACDAWQAIEGSQHLGMKVLAFFTTPDCPQAADGRHAVQNMPMHAPRAIALSEHWLTDLQKLPLVQVIVALDSLTDEQGQTLLRDLNSRFNHMHVIPSLRGLPLFGMQVSHFFSRELLLLTVRNNLGRAGLRALKRVFDLAVGGTILTVALPAMGLIALMIRKDGGPAIFGHERVGQNGERFKCLKFRTMRTDSAAVLKHLLATDPQARSEWETDFKLRNDPRVTPIGAFLRKTSLDELPQLLNVLIGQMSLVGPRPIIEDELKKYGDDLGLYLEAKPGMTGLWQVSGRNDTTYDERVALDAWYARNWSLWTDIVILFKTVGVVLRNRGAY